MQSRHQSDGAQYQSNPQAAIDFELPHHETINPIVDQLSDLAPDDESRSIAGFHHQQSLKQTTQRSSFEADAQGGNNYQTPAAANFEQEADTSVQITVRTSASRQSFQSVQKNERPMIRLNLLSNSVQQHALLNRQFDESALQIDTRNKIPDVVQDAIPILAKEKDKFEKPPPCSIKTIRFKQLRQFKTFKESPIDPLGERFNQADRKMFGRPKNILEATSEQNSMYTQESKRIMSNIVYLRDTTLLDTLEKPIDRLSQRDCYLHQNILDVNELIKDREMAEKLEGVEQDSPLARAHKRMLVSMNLQADSCCFQRPIQGKADSTLVFESRFQSGNLFLAQKISENEYNCLMQNDINSKGHTQWFFFRCTNTKAGHRVRFNISNYYKADSMFNYGMKVTVYSDRKAKEQGVGWHRAGSNIRYYQNTVRKDYSFTNYFYSLSWDYEFEFDGDAVYFSYSLPYTYSDLKRDLAVIENDEVKSSYVLISTLCKTLSVVDCPMLTITNRNGRPDKKCVVLTARQHPGETVGSFMMRGAINFLTDSESMEAHILRENFVFKVIPMLNPDGVINGNYRCSLAGCDLNRRWKHPSKILHPTIYTAKKLIKEQHQERGVVLICDMHGHSRKQNVFMYGCDGRIDQERYRILPYILSKISPIFDFQACRFSLTTQKEATARISLFKDLQSCPQVFTLESTFSGFDRGQFNGNHINQDLLEMMGRDLLKALMIQQRLYVPASLGEKGTPEEFYEQLLNELRQSNEYRSSLNNNESSCGSDSEPSEDNLEANLLVTKLPAIDSALSKQLKQYRLAKEQARQPQIRPGNQPCLQKRPPKPLENKAPQRKQKPTALKLTTFKDDPIQVPVEQIVPPPFPQKESLVVQIPPQRVTKPKPIMVDACTQTDIILQLRQVHKPGQSPPVTLGNLARGLGNQNLRHLKQDAIKNQKQKPDPFLNTYALVNNYCTKIGTKPPMASSTFQAQSLTQEQTALNKLGQPFPANMQRQMIRSTKVSKSGKASYSCPPPGGNQLGQLVPPAPHQYIQSQHNSPMPQQMRKQHSGLVHSVNLTSGMPTNQQPLTYLTAPITQQFIKSFKDTSAHGLHHLPQLQAVSQLQQHQQKQFDKRQMYYTLRNLGSMPPAHASSTVVPSDHPNLNPNNNNFDVQQIVQHQLQQHQTKSRFKHRTGDMRRVSLDFGATQKSLIYRF